MKTRTWIHIICLICLCFIVQVDAHVPVHSPPPPPTTPGIQGSLPSYLPPLDFVPPNQGVTGSGFPVASQPSGRVGRPQTPLTPGGGLLPGPNGGGSGSLTRKRQGATSTAITWELWWARNRYCFMKLPGLEPSMSDLVPLTPSSGSSSFQASILTRLRHESIALFRLMIDHDSARLRRASLIGLAMLDDNDSFPAIVKGLKDPNQTVRDSAVLALGILPHTEAKYTLLHLAQGTSLACASLDQSHVPDYVRGFAEVSLALEDVSGVESTLRDLAGDHETQPQVRALALEGLGLLGGDESVLFLMDFADSLREPSELLAGAVTALSKTRDPVAIPFLQKCLLAKNLAVRQSAALGLGQVAAAGDENIVETLYRVFTQTNDQALKGFSLISMGRIGGERAMRLLDKQVLTGKN
ncbi:MAG: HEAT repeat domain-containing protein, partial [Planctomycetes bacterium]|nr:HEAT repeat domain-containing protein [Planctomycetota bacterium]